MLRLAILLLVAATMVGALMPSGLRFPADERRQPLPVQASEVGPEQVVEPAPQWKSVELKREADGHFYADAQVNGQPVRFLVDTGASGVALTADDARGAGLVVSPGLFEVVGEGASGPVHGEWVTLDEIRLGHKSAQSVEAAVIDGRQSLLGQSFLSRFRSVEIHGDTMALR